MCWMPALLLDRREMSAAQPADLLLYTTLLTERQRNPLTREPGAGPQDLTAWAFPDVRHLFDTHLSGDDTFAKKFFLAD